MNKLREDGQWAVDLDDATETKDAIKELLQSEIGIDYKENYYTKESADDDFEKIVNAVHLLYSDGDVTVPRMAAALKTLILGGQIRLSDPEVEDILEEPGVDTTPRDKNGKALTQAQLDWKSFREWSESHSSVECKARARGDEAYGSFYRKNLEREFAAEQVGDAVTPEGQVTVARNTNPAQSLLDFARKYAKEPVANLRPKGGFITLDGEQMPWSTYQAWLTAATTAGAIR
jgi:hypothetical protein